MPYITQDRRDKLDPTIEKLQSLLEELGRTEGDLNYVITRLAGYYFKKEARYHTVAKITGVLTNVKDEFYRRLAKLYEDEVLKRNGDVPEFRKGIYD